MSLRNKSKNCHIFGAGKELPKNALPTYEDVMKYFISVTQSNGNVFRDSAKKAIEVVALDVEKIWTRASIPIIKHCTIVTRLKAYHQKYNAIKKYAENQQTSDKYKNKLKMFQKHSKLIFDIATCKCQLNTSCDCTKDRKIPIREREFLADQRGARKMMIGPVDNKISKAIVASNARKLKQKMLGESSQIPAISLTLSSDNFRSNKNVTNIENYEEFTPSIPTPNGTQNINRTLPTVARTLDRFGISDRSGAAIVSATLKDFGVITAEDSSNVIDRSKIRRVRSLARSQSMDGNKMDIDSYIGISFDSRKDNTMVYEDNRKSIKVEEHITLLKEPGSQYIGHISLQECNAKHISEKMFAFLLKNDLQKSVVAIGCDGTVVNTGYKSGIIRSLEEMFKRPLQWLVCQLHANELLLRHLFQYLDGTTTGPKSFIGPIGQGLKNCEKLPIQQFALLECHLPNITKHPSDLSTDQLYLFEICHALNTGYCHEKLAKRNPGKMCHSRWLTTANRIVRFYMSTKVPSEQLLALTKFVANVYAPMWFTIKSKPSCVYGAIHLHETIKLSRYLPKNMLMVIDPVIQRNGYFGHSENILIAMLMDQRRSIRELAVRRILKCRESTSNLTIRVFKLPTFDFKACDYSELIDWENMSEPPVTKVMSEDVILKFIENETHDCAISALRNMPCHTQATERCIKLVTEASSAVCGPENREGWIKNTLESRRLMPVFNTKKDFVVV